MYNNRVIANSSSIITAVMESYKRKGKKTLYRVTIIFFDGVRYPLWFDSESEASEVFLSVNSNLEKFNEEIRNSNL